jgi:hypothetical protein
MFSAGREFFIDFLASGKPKKTDSDVDVSLTRLRAMEL